jgi:hypothetical protein
MRRFVLGWKVLGHESRLQAQVVSYADDLVICCCGSGEAAMAAMRSMMWKLKLPVNETKTQLRRIPNERVDFLGYTIGRCYSPRTGRAYLGARPSRKVVQRVCREVSEMTSRRWLLLDARSRVERINRLLEGWFNYFYLGQASQAYRAVDRHTRRRLRRWLRQKHKVPGWGLARFPNAYLHHELGLIQLEGRKRSFPCANA